MNKKIKIYFLGEGEIEGCTTNTERYENWIYIEEFRQFMIVHETNKDNAYIIKTNSVVNYDRYKKQFYSNAYGEEITKETIIRDITYENMYIYKYKKDFHIISLNKLYIDDKRKIYKQFGNLDY